MRGLLIVIASLALVACGKPPGCGEPEVTELAKKIVTDQIVKIDPQAADIMQVSLDMVTKQGYDDDAQKWSCNSQVTLRTAPEILKIANDYVKFLQRASNPNLAQALAIQMSRLAGKPILTEQDEHLALLLAARQWRTFTQDELVAPLAFTSQLAEGSKRLVVSVNGGAGLSLFPQVTKGAFEHEDRMKAIAAAGQAQQPSASDATVKIQVVKTEACGPESVCVTNEAGTTFRTNFFALPETVKADLMEMEKSKGTLCLKGVTPDKEFETAERC
jgi:hypothetical protein